MTCAHVIGLIDAGPLAEYPRIHLEGAWRHARHCPTCGPAMRAAAALTADLAALPHGAHPDFTREVLARIERIEARAVTVDEETTASPRRDEWTAWAIVPGVLAAALVTDGVPVSTTATGTIALATGLLLYAVTLFMPVERVSDGVSGQGRLRVHVPGKR